MAKDRTVNPATAALKAAKKRDIKKGRAAVDKQRAERFAKRNPFRIQQHIDELKQAQESGNLRAKDKHLLEQLQKEHKAVLKAREQLGNQAPTFRAPREQRDDGGGNVLGKRRRGDENGRGRARDSDESETDEDVKDIPMPKDLENMPPPPRRKPRHRPQQDNESADLSLPKKPAGQSTTVLESAPQIRNLRQEAIKAFVPSSVAKNKPATKVLDGRLPEPEELDRLEQAGYRDAEGAVDEAVKEAEYEMMAREAEGRHYGREEDMAEHELRHVSGPAGERAHDLERAAMEDAEKAADEAAKEAEYEMMRRELEDSYAGDPKKEEQVAERQLRKVRMEEVEDEDG